MDAYEDGMGGSRYNYSKSSHCFSHATAFQALPSQQGHQVKMVVDNKHRDPSCT